MCIALIYCSSPPEKQNTVSEKRKYINHNDTVKYAGMETCKKCHADKFETFQHTGMGMSFDLATQKKSSARFEKHTAIYDKFSNFWYHPYWENGKLMIKEFRLSGNDTVYARTETADYIIGSGQHTNSHIFNTGGYLHQMPLTFYTQKQQWDLPPGFENGFNTRFSRKIGLECITCHNAMPQFVQGSENKFEKIPNGIDCERCHGPGSAHVKEKESGVVVDVTKEIDYSIVNPGKLPINLQFDICQRCHLQGNAVLKEGKSFLDFKPGMKLSDFWTVFLPKYENADDEFIMASHADRLKQSQCFTVSNKAMMQKHDSLKPYKYGITCVTCHNPHVSVKETSTEIFNTACNNCHNEKTKTVCTEKPENKKLEQNNCVNCHMPRSSSVDIPHVTVTDHYIRKPVSKTKTDKIKTFIGLVAVNEKNPDAKTKAKAYLQQYEKFEYNIAYLDSAKKYLPDDNDYNISLNFELLVQYYFLKTNYARITELVSKMGQNNVLNTKLINTSWDNANAWTCYRIGESYSKTNKPTEALKFFLQADKLAPFNPEFKNKLATTYVTLGNNADAKKILGQIIAQDNKFAPAYCNLGYIYLLENETEKANEYIEKSLALDPDYEQALINKAQYYIMKKENTKAKQQLQKVLKKNPNNELAKKALSKL
jgi:tetratricopeptide (TPR) repeat protein